MKNLLLILSITISLGILITSCKESSDTPDPSKTGQIIFSTSSVFGSGEYYAKINGETKNFEYYMEDPPACGTISPYCANFVVPVGTYTFEFKALNGSVYNIDFPGSHTATVTDGGCTSVRW